MDNPRAYRSKSTAPTLSQATPASMPHSSIISSRINANPFPDAAQLGHDLNPALKYDHASLDNFSPALKLNRTSPASGYMFSGPIQRPISKLNRTSPASGYMFPGPIQNPTAKLNRTSPASGYMFPGPVQHPAAKLNRASPATGYMFPGPVQHPTAKLNRASPATGYMFPGPIQHPTVTNQHGIQPIHSYKAQLYQSTSGSAQFTRNHHPTSQDSSSSWVSKALYPAEPQQSVQGSATYQQFPGTSYTKAYPYAFASNAAFANPNMGRSNTTVNAFSRNVPANLAMVPTNVASHGFDGSNIPSVATVASSSMTSPYSVAAPVTEFAYFKHLPPEVRVKIWQLLLPGPRIVEIKIKKIYDRWVDEPGKGRRQVFPKKDTRFVSNAIPPLLLVVCYESRQEARRQYEVVFPTKRSPAQIYVNFKIDRIMFANLTYLPRNSDSKMQLHYEFSQIRYFAFPYSDTTKMLTRDLFRAMPNLKEMVLFVDNRGTIDAFNSHNPIMMSPYTPSPDGLLAQELPLYKRDILLAFGNHCAAVGKSNSASSLRVTFAVVYRDIVEMMRKEGKSWDYVYSRHHTLTLEQAKDMALSRLNQTWITVEQPTLRIRG